MRPTYVTKKLRKRLDVMIAHVCDAGPGLSIATQEIDVEHEGGETDEITILVLRGGWADYLQSNIRIEAPNSVPTEWS